MEINKLIKDAHENAVKHGFWVDYEDAKYSGKPKLLSEVFTSQFLMLIVTEIAEAQEGLRHGDKENFKEELADVAIRLADLCGGLEIDLEHEIEKKMKINSNREYKHGKSF